MDEMSFKEKMKEFFTAVKEHTLLIVIDNRSKADKAVFTMVYYSKLHKDYYTFANILKELGFKELKGRRFVTHCAGRYSYFILDNIGQKLRNRGVELPLWWDKEIQYQSSI